MVLKYDSMKKICNLFLIACRTVLLVSCGGEQKSGDQQTGPQQAEVSGAEVYSTNCVICHGADGTAGMAGATDLSKSVLSHEAAVDVVTHGRNGMRAFNGLSSDEIEAVVTYIETLRK